MKIKNAMVVEVDFTLKNGEGELLESTIGKAPYVYIHGSKRVVEGFENGLENLEVDSHFDFKVPPEKGYGMPNDKLVSEVPLQAFPKSMTLKANKKLWVKNKNGRQLVRIMEMKENSAMVDYNHELAGETLHYAGKVISIRPASPTELFNGEADCSCCDGKECLSKV